MSLEHELEKEALRRDAHRFVFEAVKTKDEHNRLAPVMSFPDELCLRAVIDCYIVSGKIIQPADAKYALEAGLDLEFLQHIYDTGIIFIEKSRHVMVTWATCAYLLWRARAFPYQLVMVQSKREEDAAVLVYDKEPGIGRMSFLELSLPEHLRMCQQPKDGKYCHLFLGKGSHVWAIAEGGHIIRSHNPSVIFSDECCFQPEFGNAFTAVLPAITHGGQFIAVSSAHPGEFQMLCESDVDGVPLELPVNTKMPGFTGRVTPNTGIGVLRYYYYADTTKRPGTAKGDTWIAEEARAYPRGQEDPRWKKEMLIQYGALGGTFLIPRWEQWKDNGRIVIPPYDPRGTRLYGSYDHGYRNPAAFHVHSVDGDGGITTIWEFYGDKVPAHQIANIIRGKAGFSDDGRRHDGNPFGYDSLSYIVADPSIWNEDKPQFDGPNKSTAKIFREMGVSMVPGEAGGDVTLGEWLLGYYWKDPTNPIYRITSNCTKLIWELGQQRFKEFSAQVALNRSQPEELVDKDNHAFDGIKYLLKKFPPPEAKRKPEANPASFAWWRKHAQNPATGPRPTFRIGPR